LIARLWPFKESVGLKNNYQINKDTLMKTAIIYALNHGASEKVNRSIKFKRTYTENSFMIW